MVKLKHAFSLRGKNLFIFLLPLFFLLHGFNEYYPVVPVSDSFQLLLLYEIIALLMIGFLFLFTRSWPYASLLAFLLLAFHFFFGPAHDFLKYLFPGTWITHYVFLVPASLLAFIAFLVYLKKKKPVFPKLFTYLNLVFLLVIVFDLAVLGYKLTQHSKTIILSKEFASCDSCNKPDIYLIIADGYAGDKELKQAFHFDNSDFKNALTKRGFNIVDSSTSNYNFTPFSMASLFNMNYLVGIEGKNKSKNDRQICYEKINRNLVTDFFGSLGYDFKNHSIFQFAGQPPYRSTSFYKTGIDLVTAQTFLSRVDRDIRFNLVTKFNIQSEIKRVSYDQLKINEALYERTWNEVIKPDAKPKFVYTHLEMPHYPYYFDRNGNPKPIADLLADEKQTNLENYIGYLEYSNKKLLELVDHILTNSKKQPIIVLMSDHGFREFKNDLADHKYHFMNLNTILLPGKYDHGFYKGVSTVNQFRILLNTEFHQHLPLLRDSSSFLSE